MKNKIQEIRKNVGRLFPQFGVNKQREIVRLLYEISKREGADFKSVLRSTGAGLKQQPDQFDKLKGYLLKRRFPDLTVEELRRNIIFPEVKINKGGKMKTGPKMNLYPKHIYVEDEVKDSALAARFKKLFPRSKWHNISGYGGFVKGRRFTEKDYNSRLEHFFIIKEKYDFFLPCPCSPKSVRCGYHIFNCGTGCPYECVYCYFQGYVNSPGMLFPANVEDFFNRFDKYPQNIRIGTGEFADSLALDHITGYSIPLINFFRKRPDNTFELKTKSDNIKNLLKVKPAGNIVISWSLNPQKIIRRVELYTVSLKRRLSAARRCAQAGYATAFHFDPIILYRGWEKDYERVVDMLFDSVPKMKIAWISLGILRMTPKVKQTIESRFPDTDILDGPLVPGYDGKLRYPARLREQVYKKMKTMIQKRGGKVPLYLCMESGSMCEKCGIWPVFK